jgi:hypothetical protein
MKSGETTEAECSGEAGKPRVSLEYKAISFNLELQDLQWMGRWISPRELPSVGLLNIHTNEYMMTQDRWWWRSLIHPTGFCAIGERCIGEERENKPLQCLAVAADASSFAACSWRFSSLFQGGTTPLTRGQCSQVVSLPMTMHNVIWPPCPLDGINVEFCVCFASEFTELLLCTTVNYFEVLEWRRCQVLPLPCFEPGESSRRTNHLNQPWNSYILQ